MKKYLGYLLSGVMALSLAGCSGGGGDSAATPTPASGGSTETAAPAASTEGSSMTVAIAMQFDTLDPALSTTVYNGYVINSIYSGMLRLGDDDLPHPDLCTDYEISDDGLQWTFHLRDDITFSDGTPITAENFVFSVLRALSYGAENAFRTSSICDYIVGAEEYRANAVEVGASFDCLTEDHSNVGVEAVDDHTVVYTLNTPVPFFDINMSGGGVWSPLPLDTPQHDSVWSITPGYATNGAYNLASIDLNDAAVVQKNPTYWNADAVKMEEIVWQVVTDPNAQLAQFESGDIDVALSVPTEAVAKYLDTENLWSLMYPSCYSLCVNSGPNGPDYLKNKNVRKALYIAIDKEAIVNVIGNTDLYPLLDGYVPFGLPGADGDFRTERDADGYELHYDPEEAVRLLNEEGYDENNKLHITYKYSKNSFHEDVATVLQSQWGALGCVDVDFDATEGNVYYSQIDEGDIEIGRYGLQTSDSPMTMLKNWTTGNLVTPLLNETEGAIYDQMINDAWAVAADPAAFAQKLHEAEDYLVQEEVLQFPLFQFAQAALKQSNLHDAKFHITTFDFLSCYKD
ncbi:MAG: peptide ABC transporter substrate-binding protein [Solobacterium sp.]|nr:peptide ABC transporter substrate-binding protein [Solobacterium sp.]